MRVVHVINSLGYGGAERQLASLCEFAGENGDSCKIITLRSTISRICLKNEGAWLNGGMGDGGKGAVRVLMRELRTGKKTIFIAWMYHSWLFVLLFGLLSMRHHTYFLYCRHSDFDSLNFRTKIIARLAFALGKSMGAHVVYNSTEALENHKRFNSGMAVSVIHNGFGFDHLASSGDRKRVLGYFGRNHHDKGADRLATIVPKLLRELTDWRFHIAGPGMNARAKEILDAVRVAGIDERRVRIEDVVSDVRAFYAGIDVLVVPSRTESFPNVIVEASAAGVLVAATDVGENRNILSCHIRCARGLDELIEVAIELCQLSADASWRLATDVMDSVRSLYSWAAVYPLHKKLWQEVA